jgi:hypothetical protein
LSNKSSGLISGMAFWIISIGLKGTMGVSKSKKDRTCASSTSPPLSKLGGGTRNADSDGWKMLGWSVGSFEIGNIMELSSSDVQSIRSEDEGTDSKVDRPSANAKVVASFKLGDSLNKSLVFSDNRFKLLGRVLSRANSSAVSLFCKSSKAERVVKERSSTSSGPRATVTTDASKFAANELKGVAEKQTNKKEEEIIM